jgi:hypothetical protein
MRCLSFSSLQVIHQKSKKTFDEITHDLCPVKSELHFSWKWILIFESVNSIIIFIDRPSVYSNYTGLAQCIGMISMERIV